MAQQQTTAVERWAATHPVRVKDRPSIDPTVHPRPSELASEAAAREVARARGPGPPHRRALPASSGTEMLSTHLGPGCPPATDPHWCLQVVRRRTQRRKSGLTSLLFGELCAAGSCALGRTRPPPAPRPRLSCGSQAWGGWCTPGGVHPRTPMDSKLPWGWERALAGTPAAVTLWTSQG